MSVIYNINFTPVPGTTTKVEYRLETELDWTFPTSPANPTPLYYYPLTLSEGNRYYVRVTSIATDGKCVNASTILVIDVATADDCPLITSLDGEYVYENLVAYWGWKADNSVLSDVDIQLSSNFQDVTVLQDITCDFSGGFGTPYYLWMAEPLACSPKSTWQDTVDSLNNGNIGTSEDLFNTPTESAAFRFYITEYVTEQDDPISFQV